MRVIALIAWREYLDNVRTKAFWLTILIIPLILLGMYFLQSALSRTTPVRHFIVIDQSGRYEEAVSIAVEREHQRLILTDFVEYLIENRRETNLEASPANATNAANQLIDDVDANEVAALDEWLDSGGLNFALAMATPYLKENIQPFEQPDPPFVAAEPPAELDLDASPERIIEALRPYLSGEQTIQTESGSVDLFALILIPEPVDDGIIRPGDLPAAAGSAAGVQYWARNLTDVRLPDAVQAGINAEIREKEYQQRGVDTQTVRDVQRTRMTLNPLDPTAAAGEEAVSLADTFRQFAPIAFVYLMFVSLTQNVQYLLSNTVEEKSNRIIEVLLASVTSNELMIGKLLGIGLAGLTTIGTWLLSFFVFIVMYDSAQTDLIGEVLEVILGSDLIPWFVFYYFSGCALYSGLFLAVGSLCNTLKEAQAMMTPMIVIQIVPLAMMAFVVMDPNNGLVRALSWFPLFTPYLMMNRAAANPPVVDVVGTTALLLVSIVLMLWLSGKIFRLGVLRTGQPPRVRELWRLLTATA